MPEEVRIEVERSDDSCRLPTLTARECKGRSGSTAEKDVKRLHIKRAASGSKSNDTHVQTSGTIVSLCFLVPFSVPILKINMRY